MRSALIPALATVLLSACVLQSDQPLFSDAEATPLLGSIAQDFAVFTDQDGVWVPGDAPMVTVIPEGRHYLVAEPATAGDPAGAERYYFVPLDATHSLIQAVEKGTADYAIATWNGQELLVSVLDCDALKSHAIASKIAQFQDDDCALRPATTPALDLFRGLITAAPPPGLRLVRSR